MGTNSTKKIRGRPLNSKNNQFRHTMGNLGLLLRKNQCICHAYQHHNIRVSQVQWQEQQ